MPNTITGWVDTHVHWDAAEFDIDRDAALSRAFTAGVRNAFNPSVCVSGIDKVQALCQDSLAHPDWPRIWPAYGVHPLYVQQAAENDLASLETALKSACPIAIGEIGLDGYPGAPDLEQQRGWFEDQLVLAIEYALPVIMHVRYAVEDVIRMLKRVQGRHRKLTGGIAHAYNGSAEQAEQLIRLGFLLGFGGSLTYEGSTRIRRLATELPVECLVLETDAPDMSPSWLRQQRNESAALPRIAEMLAQLRGISVETLRVQIGANVLRQFPAIAGKPCNGAVAHPD